MSVVGTIVAGLLSGLAGVVITLFAGDKLALHRETKARRELLWRVLSGERKNLPKQVEQAESIRDSALGFVAHLQAEGPAHIDRNLKGSILWDTPLVAELTERLALLDYPFATRYARMLQNHRITQDAIQLVFDEQTHIQMVLASAGSPEHPIDRGAAGALFGNLATKAQVLRSQFVAAAKDDLAWMEAVQGKMKADPSRRA
jgi:hypothetical protein